MGGGGEGGKIAGEQYDSEAHGRYRGVVTRKNEQAANMGSHHLPMHPPTACTADYSLSCR